MALAQLTNIEKILGDRLMFDHLSLNIEKGERVGFIGDNGAGKTTLFRILMGMMKPDVGDVSIARGVRVGMLDQNPTFTAGHSLIDEAELAFAELHQLAHDLRDLEHEMGVAEGDELDRVLKKYEVVQHNYEEAGGYAWHHKLESTLFGVGFAKEDFEKPVESLSGGQRSRLALAKLLINEPDLLLLDEPTNHLDLVAVEWLENYLLNFSGAMLVISHDRYLLDRIATRIVWLTRRQISSYPGNYSSFVVQKDLAELTQRRQHEEQQADIEKQAEYIRRFKAGQRARQAKGRERRLNRLLSSDQVVQAVNQSKSMHLRLSTDQRAGDRLLRVDSLTKSFDGRVVWKDAKFELTRGDRVGIIGPNGSGKTTLLRTLTGELDADNGDVRWGSNISIGYYDQKLDDFDPELSVLDEILSDVEGYNEKQLRDALGSMLFSGDDVEKPMALLSGGEKARVALAKLILQRPNVLLLDEPTNHLDIQSCEALERSLAGFPGSILVVSHDRSFLDRMVKKLLVIEPPDVSEFEGTWKDWNEKLKQKQQDTQAAAKSASKARPAESKKQAEAKKPIEAKKPGEGNKPAEARRGEPSQQNRPAAKPAKDNPYARPFGRLSVAEIERNIAEVEASLGASQLRMTDAKIFKDPAASKRLQDEIQQNTRKLKQLEEEYFARQS